MSTAPSSHGSEWAWRLLGPIITWLTRLVFRIRVQGAQHLPPDGPALIVANHVGHLDPVVLGVTVLRHGRRPRFLALANLWQMPVVGWILRLTEMIPVQRGGGVQRMVDAACEAMDRDHLVIIYPEGTIRRDPDRPPEPRPGSGKLALRTWAPVIPVALAGMERGSGLWPPFGRRAAVVFGEPIEIGGHGAGTEHARRTVAADALLAAIKSLEPRAQAIAAGDPVEP